MYYVIHVKTGKEQDAIDDILKYKTHEVEFDIFSPFRKELRKYKGVWKEVLVRCFPGYVFVETDDIKGLFKDLYWIPGYQRILGREGLTDNFVPLDPDESRMIDILYNAGSGRVTPISDIEVIEGDKIRILDGPLMGITSSIKKVNLHKRMVEVEFMLCKRKVSAIVGINIITKVNV